MYPENLKYSEEHEWLLENNGVATIGITSFAVESLGDIVFIELPQTGTIITQFSTFGEVESVKTFKLPLSVKPPNLYASCTLRFFILS